MFRNTKNAIYKQLLRSHARPALLWIGLGALVHQVVMLASPFYLINIYDQILPAESYSNLWVVTGSILFINFVGFLGDWGLHRLVPKAGLTLGHAIAEKLFPYMLEQSRYVGSNPRKSLNDTAAVMRFATSMALVKLALAIFIPLWFLILGHFHWLFVFTGCVFIALLLAMSWASERICGPKDEVARVKQEELQGYVNYALAQAPVNRVIGRQKVVEERFQERYSAMLAADLVSHNWRGFWKTLSQNVRLQVNILILCQAAWLCLNGTMSPGMIIAISVFMTRALEPIDAIIAGAALRKRAIEADRELEKQFCEMEGDRSITFRGEITCLTLPKSSSLVVGGQVLHHLTSEINLTRDSITLVCGPSGVGKSSFLRAILGDLLLSGGRVLINGSCPIDAVSRFERQIGDVPQERCQIEKGATIVSFISDDHDVDRVIDACKRVGLHDSIVKWPDTYQTVIGEGGRKLSGGELVRLELARAICHGPQVLILDEPTAGLDEEATGLVARVIEEEKVRGAMVVLATHEKRLKEIKHDTVIELGA